MRGPVVLAAALLALLVPLGFRVRTLAGLPEFEHGLPEVPTPRLSMSRVEFGFGVAGGAVSVRALLAEPGHDTFGPFRFGPAAFLRLRGVEAERTAGGARTWIVRSPEARLRGKTLEFPDRAYYVRGDRPQASCRDARIELDSGRLDAPE